MNKYLLALDGGTGSFRAILFDTKGKQIALSQEEWTHHSEPNIPNSMRFDCTKNWELIVHCIQNVLAISKVNPSDIVALSSSSMREGIVLYDKEGNELWAVANVDARAGEEVKFLKENYPHIEESFYQQSGQTFALGAIPRILWLKNHNVELYNQVAKISMISDWILFKLSGIIAIDPSNGGTTGIFDLEKRDWASEMMEQVGLKNDIFPPCFESGTVIGSVNVEASEQTGLSLTTKVVMGGGDVQLGSLGLGIVENGGVAILGGSFWQQIVNIPTSTKPPLDMNIRINPHVIKDMSQAEGITFFSGLIMRWFRDAFCELEKLESQKNGIDTYALLEEKAKQIPVGSYGITPIFSDSMKYGKWYHASPSFLNLSLDATICNKASMFRSLEENACIVSNINLKKIKQFSGIEIDTIVFAGGASKGKLWCQILADVTGCTIKIPKITEATALGVCMCAGVGAGIFSSLKVASKELVIFEKEYYPNMENHIVYEEIEVKWIKLYEEQLKLVDMGLTESMWKAPGL
ncbi:MAG: autoinducer-2 kinase [Arcobacteraceae bacterium]|jgi:autoinducer 2 (AI-2) kinase|nr:autoinducer-2 kinase [Arcobacteraceae bacterium]